MGKKYKISSPAPVAESLVGKSRQVLSECQSGAARVCALCSAEGESSGLGQPWNASGGGSSWVSCNIFLGRSSPRSAFLFLVHNFSVLQGISKARARRRGGQLVFQPLMLPALLLVTRGSPFPPCASAILIWVARALLAIPLTRPTLASMPLFI